MYPTVVLLSGLVEWAEGPNSNSGYYEYSKNINSAIMSF